MNTMHIQALIALKHVTLSGLTSFSVQGSRAYGIQWVEGLHRLLSTRFFGEGPPWHNRRTW